MAKTKEDSAKELYFVEFSQKKIADILEVSEQTVSKWVRKNGWDVARSESFSKKDAIESRVMSLIDYSLAVLEQFAKKALDQGGDLKPIDRGEIDALAKLYSTIKTREITFAQKIKIITDFNEYLNDQDQDIAKQIIRHSERFILKLKEDNYKA